MLKCPVCGAKTELVYRDVMDNWCLMEEEFRCGKHYDYYYETGNSIEIIDGHEFMWSYVTPLSKLDHIRRTIVIWVARRKYDA